MNLPPPPGGGAKIWVFGWLGKKYDDLLSKKANIIGKGAEKLKIGEIFTVLGGKNMFLEKGGGVAKISHFCEIYTPEIFKFFHS